MAPLLASEAVELGRALTGQELPLSDSDPAGLIAQLAASGWDRQQLVELRRQRQAARQVWPFPVELAVRRELGFARFDAALAKLRDQLGLAGLAELPPAPARGLNPDEQRLNADRPPHW